MKRLTESSLRLIVKQELKKILNEMSPMYVGSGEWRDEPDADDSVAMDPIEFTKAANEAYIKSSTAWRYEYQPKEGLDFSDVYQKYLNEKVYPRYVGLSTTDKKVPPSSKEFIEFCLSNDYMTAK